jgi:predicted dehydrogenase
MNNELGVCIVGCGFMGSVHAERWQANSNARIVAVVDKLDDRAEKLANLYKLDTYYHDYKEAIALPGVDIVSVCIPTCLHPEVTIAAADLGKHVLCEKPIALSLDEADKMIAAGERNGVKLGLGFMRRFSPVLADLRAYLEAGNLGRPAMYTAFDIREMRPKLEMHDASANGGPVIDMAVHLLDLWAYIFDSQPVEVFAQGLTLAENRPELINIAEAAIDTATIVVRYASGDIGTFVVSWGLPSKVNPEGRPDQIYGPQGLGEIYYIMNKQEFRVMKKGGVWETASISHEDMYQNQINDFAQSILEDKPLSVSALDGKRALMSALAACDAIRTGEPVFFE